MSLRMRFAGIPSLLLSVLLCACVPGPPGPRAIQAWAYLIPASFRADHITRRLAGYDTLCIGVYRLNARGRIYAKPSLDAAARHTLAEARKDKRLFPLIALQGPGAGASMLREPRTRIAAVNAVAEVVRANQYDGAHIDFEFLRGESAPDYRAFLAALKSHPHMRGLTLSIAAFPPLHATPEAAAFFDLSIIGGPIDEIVYMTYDYHFQTPGPVTDLAWARLNIDIVLNEFPASKIWLGVPAYGYVWPPGSAADTNPGRPRAVTEREGLAQCRRFGCARHESGTLRVKREDRVLYFSDSVTRKRMAELARDLQLRGTAMWRVGFEVYEPPAPAPPDR